MRPLWMFLVRNYFVILFVVLEGIALAMFINNTYYQRSIIVNATNDFSGSLFDLRTGLTQYLSLKSINEDLARQNAILMSEQKKSFIITDTASFYVQDSLYRQQYEYIAAKVINNSTTRKSNYLTLDKGHHQKIRKDMAVICPEGVVGIVTEASDNFCSVMSLLNPKTRISAKLKKNDYVGTVLWEGGSIHTVSLKDIPTHVKIAKGDTVITSGYSLLFPEGIMIGIIEGFDAKGGNDFYQVNVALSTDFSNIRHVYIVNNLKKEELQQLESETEKE
jgi:rod shape-determining protein MreC